MHVASPGLGCVNMGCLNTKEKYNVNKEERGLKNHRVSSGQQRFSENYGYGQTQSRRNSQPSSFTVTLGSEVVKRSESHRSVSERNTSIASNSSYTDSYNESSVKPSGLSSRNQFDRASQLRRSKKKRRKSEDNILTPRKDQSSENSSVATPKTALEIVKQETTSLNQTTSSGRAEYNSSYGNLI